LNQYWNGFHESGKILIHKSFEAAFQIGTGEEIREFKPSTAAARSICPVPPDPPI
jgi:hypothetical protein